jgi:hypothetical protein
MAKFKRFTDEQEQPTVWSDYPGFPSRWSHEKPPLHRYTLWRNLGLPLDCSDLGYIQFIGLNPSTADDEKNDPTVTRCINYAKEWGYFAFCMTNIFAFRSTDPNGLYSCYEPVGEENDYWLEQVAVGAKRVVLAWGVHGAYRNRGMKVFKMLNSLDIKVWCLGTNADGSPKHPLYLRADQQLERYRG